MGVHSARQHAEWLSLVEVSGPFLSMAVLLRVFPQGLFAHDPRISKQTRLALEEWSDNQFGLRADPAIHTAWIEFVLHEVLELPAASIARDQAIPEAVKAVIAEHSETLRPSFVIQAPEAPGQALCLGVVVPAAQDLEKPLAGSSWKASPASRMLELLRATKVPLGVLTNGDRWMLVAAPPQQTTSFISWYAELWFDEPVTLQAFRSLLGAQRFLGVPDDETLPALLAESVDNQQEVTDQLGAQVRAAVELLVQSLDRIDQDRQRSLLRDVPVERLYEASLTVMMRLVFLFSAEERGLLLLGDQLYDQFYAVSTLRAQLREVADRSGEEILERRFDAWSRLLATFRVVFGGVEHEALRLPAYGGNLFDPDRYPFLEGRALGSSWRKDAAHPLPIDNRTVLHLLESLQILRVRVPGGGYEPRRLSFRALDIEQIGHVYEGLLDHTAARATEPMLGVLGAKGLEPELALSDLEQQATLGSEALIKFLAATTQRSTSALTKALEAVPEHREVGALRVACGNDSELLQRVVPFWGLLRRDSFERPLVITTGSVFVTSGTDRRSSGTHYTPRSLTEPLVQYALEPLVYVGPRDGLPRTEWRLRSPAELLRLKICDIAMGSGAFLVQACRYLGERLVEAWEKAEHSADGVLLVLPEAEPSDGSLREQVVPLEADERLTLARRLVADRCLYGVDRNPLAVEMAKLSLWLITLQRNRPFTFLDHALRHGDSLLGVDLDQLTTWSLHKDQRSTVSMFAKLLEDTAHQAIALRAKLRHRQVIDIRDVEEKERLLHEAEQAMFAVKQAADVLAATAFLPSKTRHDLSEDWLAQVSTALTMEPVNRALLDNVHRAALNKLGTHPPFHWALEFPEVFVQALQDTTPTETTAEQIVYTAPEPGFAAIIGNPPFQGGKKITGALGTDYRDYMVEILAGGQRGNADLCGYFFLRACDLLRPNGVAGLIATNTIAQGDTREVSLDQLVQQGTTIIRAIPSEPWPGVAALEVAHVWFNRGSWKGDIYLNGNQVRGLTSYLAKPGAVTGDPYTLKANENKSFQGSIVLGMGFVLEPEQAQELIDNNSRNKNVLLPYLNGQDLNSNPDQSASRWVINFFDRTEEAASAYKEPFEVVMRDVKPERQRRKENGQYALRKPLPQRWWQYADKRPALYNTIADMERVLVISRVSTHHAFALIKEKMVFADRLVVVAFDTYNIFCLLSSTIHEGWAHRPGSTTHETRKTYFPESSFETFPFPDDLSGLEEIGERYHEHRRSIMLDRWEGLTQTYNRFHDPAEQAADIQRLRELHREMDEAVKNAYGWDDLDLDHDVHDTKQGLRYTISEAARREVLDRLLALNHERYAQEVAQGLHDKKKPKAKKSKAKKNTPKNDDPSAPETISMDL